MTEIKQVAAPVIQANAARNNGNVPRPTPAQIAAPVEAARARVDLVHSQTSYTASLDTLRKANKMMMGYMLNIKV